MITRSTKTINPKLPNEVTSMYDLGFLGVENDYPEQKSSLPIKKEKGCELMVQQKEYNRNHSAKKDSDRTYYCQVKEIQNNK